MRKFHLEEDRIDRIACSPTKDRYFANTNDISASSQSFAVFDFTGECCCQKEKCKISLSQIFPAPDRMDHGNVAVLSFLIRPSFTSIVEYCLCIYIYIHVYILCIHTYTNSYVLDIKSHYIIMFCLLDCLSVPKRRRTGFLTPKDEELAFL